jgi:hypothetical protein
MALGGVCRIEILRAQAQQELRPPKEKGGSQKGDGQDGHLLLRRLRKISQSPAVLLEFLDSFLCLFMLFVAKFAFHV